MRETYPTLPRYGTDLFQVRMLTLWQSPKETLN